MERSQHHYHSYTLRLSRIAGTGIWRATLYCAQDGKRYHFGDLAELYAFLQQATSNPHADSCPPQEPSEP